VSCEDVQKLLASHIVGGLAAEEAQAVRTHVRACPACAAEAERTGAVVALLELVPEEAYVPVHRADAGLSRMLARVADERRRAGRRRLALAVAATVVSAGLAGTAGVVVGRSGDAPPPAAAPSTEADRVLAGRDTASGVAASVGEIDKGWGTALQLRLTGVSKGNRCRLIAVDTGGRREVAATWAVPGGGYDPTRGLRVDGATGFPSEAVARYVVETLDGRRLVTVAGQG
jgi:anti-sigma factor RsiW